MASNECSIGLEIIRFFICWHRSPLRWDQVLPQTCFGWAICILDSVSISALLPSLLSCNWTQLVNYCQQPARHLILNAFLFVCSISWLCSGLFICYPWQDVFTPSKLLVSIGFHSVSCYIASHEESKGYYYDADCPWSDCMLFGLKQKQQLLSSLVHGNFFLMVLYRCL